MSYSPPPHWSSERSHYDLNRRKELMEPAVEAIQLRSPHLRDSSIDDLRGLLQEQQQAIQARHMDAAGYLRPRLRHLAFISKSYTPPPAAPAILAHADQTIRPLASATTSEYARGSDPRIVEIVDRVEAIARAHKELTVDDILARVAPLAGDHTSPMGTPRLATSTSFGLQRSRAVFDASPFAAPLVRLNVAQSAMGSVVFRPWRSSAVIMFVDLSGYSRITTALASRGPHVLSDVVNSYLERIIRIVVSDFQGEVVNFAGDALMVVFASESKYHAECCMAACACAIQLQKVCGNHAVPDDPTLVFRMHIGISFGEVEMCVFDNPSVKHMVRSMHFFTGPAVQDLSRLVDAAAAGEIVVSQSVVALCRRSIDVVPTTQSADMFFLTSAGGIPHLGSVLDCIGQYNVPGGDEGEDDEDDWIDMENVFPMFVHPAIASRLASTTKLSEGHEMRFLCVLFILRRDHGGLNLSVEDWFAAVQKVLDRHRCPVVKLLDDDKGVHVIAAVNLFSAERNPALVGVEAASELTHREIGTDIGMACGSTFCGVIGSPLACRWDITGACVVRACRLMQHATKHRVDIQGCCCDASVYDNVGDVSVLSKLAHPAELKGSNEPVTVYNLSPATRNLAAWRILSPVNACEECHKDEYLQVSAAVGSQRPAVGVICITGPSGIGKATLAVRALHDAEIIPVSHTAVRDALPLSIAETIAGWHIHSSCPALRSLAENISRAWRQEQVGSTIELLKRLVAHAGELGMRFALVVRQAQLLDSLSLAFIRLVSAAPPVQDGLQISHGPKFVFVLCLVPFLGSRFEADLPMALSSVKLHPVPEHVATALAVHRGTWRIHPELSNIICSKSCGIPQFVDAIIAHIQRQRPYVTRMSADGVLSATSGAMNIVRGWSWTIIAPQLTPGLTGLLDQVPASHRMVLKVLAAATSADGTPPFPAWVIERVAQRRLKKKLEPNMWSLLAGIHIVRYSASFVDGISQDACVDTTTSRQMLVQFHSRAVRDVILTSAVPDHMTSLAEECLSALDRGAATQAVTAIRIHRASLLLAQHNAKAALEEVLQDSDVVCCDAHKQAYARIVAQIERSCYAADSLTQPAADKQHQQVEEDIFAMMPMDIVVVKNLIPPIALGPAAALLCHMGWRIRSNYLDAVSARPGGGSEASLAAELVPRYMRIMSKTARLVGETGPFHRSVLAKEQASLVQWLTFTPAVDQAVRNAAEFFKFASDTCVRRAGIIADASYKWRTRSSASFASVTCSDPRHETLRTAVSAILESEKGLEHIFAAGCEDLAHNMSQTERSRLEGGFHSAMMALAMGRFAPGHPKLSLENIRAAVLQHETETFATFSAFVYLHWELRDVHQA